MKKFYFTLIALLFAFAGNAANVVVTCGGKVVADGDVVEATDVAAPWGFPQILPHLKVEAKAAGEVSVTLDVKEIVGGGEVSFCYGGMCDTYVAGQSGTKSETLKLDEVKDLEIEHNLPDYEEQVAYKSVSTVTVKHGVTKVLSFTLVMKKDPEGAGVNGVESSNMLKVYNNALHYNLSQAAEISVYAITGARVKHVNVSGTGNISLANLPKGIYLYTVGGSKSAKGKFVVR